MKMRRLIEIGLFVLLAGAGSLPVFAAESVNRIVAIVNNEVITLHELNERMREMTGMSPTQLRDRNEEAFLDARQKIVQMMMDEKIAEAKIRELGIKISQKQVDETVERLKSENRWTQEDLLANLQKEGLPYDKFLERMKKNLERMNLINSEVKSKIIITEDRIKRYYEEQKAKYTGDARVHLAGIFLVRKDADQSDKDDLLKKAEEILHALKRGEDFGVMAKKYSDGPGVEEGGDLGVFKISQLDPELRKVLTDLPVGGVSELVVRREGIQILKILKREGGEEQSLEDVRDSIYSAIYQEEVNDRYATWIKQLREKAYMRVNF